MNSSSGDVPQPSPDQRPDGSPVTFGTQEHGKADMTGGTTADTTTRATAGARAGARAGAGAGAADATLPSTAVRLALTPRLQALAMQKLAAVMLRTPKDLRFATRPIARPEVVDVPSRHGLVRCLVYRPHPDAPLASGTGSGPPVVLQIHGGSFIVRTPHQDDHIDDFIASEVGAVVVNPDYSAAPQARYPVAEEQCYDIAEWVVAAGGRLGWDGSRIGLGGTSAGGKFAINVAQTAYATGAFTPRAITLGCALIDATRTNRRPAQGTSMVSPRMQRLVGDAYFPDVPRRREPLASPILDPQLVAAMPPALIMTGGRDALGPEMDEMARRLLNAGAEVTHLRFPDSDHGFSHFRPVDVARQSLEAIGAHLRRHLPTAT